MKCPEQAAIETESRLVVAKEGWGWLVYIEGDC